MWNLALHRRSSNNADVKQAHGDVPLPGALCPGRLRDAGHSTLSNQTAKEPHMPNPTFKRMGWRIQFLGLFILLADAVFAFFCSEVIWETATWGRSIFQS